MTFTFEDYRTREMSDGKVYVTAMCVETEQEAYVIVKTRPDAISRAATKLAKFS